jgi:hypothetical protein
MIATGDNLEEFAKMARAEQARGATTLDFEVEATCGFMKYVNLWEDAIGEVVGRIFERADEPVVPGFPQPRNVAYFRVRCGIPDVLEAWRRRQDRELREFGAIT